MKYTFFTKKPIFMTTPYSLEHSKLFLFALSVLLERNSLVIYLQCIQKEFQFLQNVVHAMPNDCAAFFNTKRSQTNSNSSKNWSFRNITGSYGIWWYTWSMSKTEFSINLRVYVMNMGYRISIRFCHPKHDNLHMFSTFFLLVRVNLCLLSRLCCIILTFFFN